METFQIQEIYTITHLFSMVIEFLIYHAVMCLYWKLLERATLLEFKQER